MAFPPLSLPIAAFTLDVVTNGVRQRSPYSFAQVTYDFMGGAWAATIDLAVLQGRDRETFLRWIASLDGPVGTFELPALGYEGPYGSVVANVTVNAAAPQRAQVVQLAVPVGQSLAADDKITIDGHLHVITDAPASVAGVQDVTIWPRLRSAVASADPVEVENPFGSWALASNRNGIGYAVDLRTSAALELFEAL